MNPSPPGIRLSTPKVSCLQGTNHNFEVCHEPRKIEFHPFWQSAIYGSMAPTIYLIRSQELHRHDQNSWSQQQLSFQVARANLRRWQLTWKWFTGWNILLGEVLGETRIWSTSLESNLSHSAFSCCAMVVSGTNIEVVEPGMKWTSYWVTNNSRG